ncbi:MAG: hypothetical protein IPM14_15295 [bacterium]|nr:hypothetical protein [bacterium]
MREKLSAGADLEYHNEMRNYSSLDNEKDSRELADLFLMIYNFAKPVIVASGAAIAGGADLASVCDIIVAGEKCKSLNLFRSKIGFIPAIVSTFLIRVGEGMAKQLLLSGDIIEAKRAYEIGSVNYLLTMH